MIYMKKKNSFKMIDIQFVLAKTTGLYNSAHMTQVPCN